MMPFALLLFLSVSTPAVAAPEPPGTDIWLTELKWNDGELSAGDARNLTARPGYDNQPAFVTAHSLLFTSIDDAGQADAWRYDLATGSATPLATTRQSEYSPTPTPGGDISVVQVSLEGVQQLATLAPGETQFQVLFPMLEGIGYHAWLDAERVALFMVREPSELHIANRVTGEVAVLAKDIGRSLQRVPGSGTNLAFTEPGQDGKRWIKQLDLVDRRITPIAPSLEDNEDFVLLPDGTPVMADGKALFAWRDAAWHEFARFDAVPGDITRLTTSADGKQLAMVVSEAR